MYLPVSVPYCTSLFRYLIVPPCFGTLLYLPVSVPYCTSLFRYLIVPPCFGTLLYLPVSVPYCTSLFQFAVYGLTSVWRFCVLCLLGLNTFLAWIVVLTSHRKVVYLLLFHFCFVYIWWNIFCSKISFPLHFILFDELRISPSVISLSFSVIPKKI